MKRVINQEIYEFAVYSQRSRLVRPLVLFLVFDLIYVAFLFFCLLLVAGFLFVRPNPEPSLVIAVQIFMAFLSLLISFTLILLLSFTIFIIRRLVSQKPVLLITRQGIDFRELPFIGSTFLAWNEMASLSIVPVPQSFAKPRDHLCIDPKNHVQFLSRFHSLQRFFVRLSSRGTGTLIHLSQWFFSEPVGGLLLQIQENFQEELQTYEVQVMSAYREREFMCSRPDTF